MQEKRALLPLLPLLVPLLLPLVFVIPLPESLLQPPSRLQPLLCFSLVLCLAAAAAAEIRCWWFDIKHISGHYPSSSWPGMVCPARNKG